MDDNSTRLTVAEFFAGVFISLFIVAFALLFLWVGVWGGILPLYSQTRDWRTAASYVAVPARVENVVLDERSSKKHGKRYLAQAQFSYEFEGRPYTSHRINIYGSPDTSRGYQQTMYKHLLSAQLNQRPVELWVDPTNPGNALHDRTLNWDKLSTHLVFALVGTPVGLWVLGFLYRGWRRVVRG